MVLMKVNRPETFNKQPSFKDPVCKIFKVVCLTVSYLERFKVRWVNTFINIFTDSMLSSYKCVGVIM